jgi:peptide/nickel transport system substrate-binding protein
MSSARPEGELVVAIPYDAVEFNEVFRNYTGAGGYFAANNIYSRLVVLDVFESGDIHPDLAARWDILDDGALRLPSPALRPLARRGAGYGL